MRRGLNTWSEISVRSYLYNLNLHDFRYEGGAPINSGSQIPLVIEKREYGLGYQARAGLLNWYKLTWNG